MRPLPKPLVHSFNTKQIVLKVPKTPASFQSKVAQIAKIEDGTFVGDLECLQILLSFQTGQPNDKAKKKKGATGKDDVSRHKLKVLSSNFQILNLKKLPLVKPQSLTEPYRFMVTNNYDTSIIETPRLSVTKLLTRQWCELRQYYDVYSGSLRQETKAMSQGTEHHNKLEDSTHKKVDLVGVYELIKNLKAEILKGIGTKIETSEDDLLRLKLLQSKQGIELLFVGESTKVNALASVWVDNILNRMFHLICTGEAREVLVHSYLDFDSERIIEDNSSLEIARGVLVSGIIDLLEIRQKQRSNEVELLRDIADYVECTFRDGIIDLEQFIPEVSKMVREHEALCKLRVVDVKTRSSKLIPSQSSVLAGAKLQVYNYRKYLQIMSGNALFAYQMLVENAQRRGCDVNAPIGLQELVRIIKGSGHILQKDLIKLANGQPIGFLEFDIYNPSETYEYDLQLLGEQSDLLEQLKKEGVNLYPLLKKWKKPPTLRYLAARASQLYGVISPLVGKSTIEVEYHHNRTGEKFKTLEYRYNEKEFQKEIGHSVKFWKGTRPPDIVDDVSKCRYCEFETRCSLPHPNLSFSLSDDLKSLIER